MAFNLVELGDKHTRMCFLDPGAAKTGFVVPDSRILLSSVGPNGCRASPLRVSGQSLPPPPQCHDICYRGRSPCVFRYNAETDLAMLLSECTPAAS